MIEPSEPETAHAADVGLRIIGVEADRIRFCAARDPSMIGFVARDRFLSMRPPFAVHEIVAGGGWRKVGEWTPPR